MRVDHVDKAARSVQLKLTGSPLQLHPQLSDSSKLQTTHSLCKLFLATTNRRIQGYIICFIRPNFDFIAVPLLSPFRNSESLCVQNVGIMAVAEITLFTSVGSARKPVSTWAITSIATGLKCDGILR